MPKDQKFQSVNQDICARLLKFRLEYIDTNQRYASEKLEYTQSTISEVERGKRMPTFKLLERYMAKYRLNLEWLNTGKGSPQLDEKVVRKGSNLKELEAQIARMDKLIQTLERRYLIMAERLEKLEEQLSAHSV